MQLYLKCVPTTGATASPCATVAGVKYAPTWEPSVPPALDYSQVGLFFGFAVTVVLVPWVIGVVVGSIIRVIRGA